MLEALNGKDYNIFYKIYYKKYYLWNEIFKFNPEESRILTYIVSPILLSAVGLYLIENKPVNLSF